jgi:hypothetical protein
MPEAHRGSIIGEASCTEVPGILRSLKEEIIRP